MPDNHNHTTEKFKRQADERGWLEDEPEVPGGWALLVRNVLIAASASLAVWLVAHLF